LRGLGEFRRHRGLHHKPAGARVGNAERTQRRERDIVQSLTLAALRSLGVADARARGLVVQTAMPTELAKSAQ